VLQLALAALVGLSALLHLRSNPAALHTQRKQVMQLLFLLDSGTLDHLLFWSGLSLA